MRLAMPGSDPRVRESPIITQQRLARVTDTLMRLECYLKTIYVVTENITSLGECKSY